MPPEPKKSARDGGGAAPAPEDLSAEERAVFKLLSADAPTQIDELARLSGLTISGLASALLGLEMRGLVRQLPGKSFARRM